MHVSSKPSGQSATVKEKAILFAHCRCCLKRAYCGTCCHGIHLQFHLHCLRIMQMRLDSIAMKFRGIPQLNDVDNCALSRRLMATMGGHICCSKSREWQKVSEWKVSMVQEINLQVVRSPPFLALIEGWLTASIWHGASNNIEDRLHALVARLWSRSLTHWKSDGLYQGYMLAQTTNSPFERRGKPCNMTVNSVPVTLQSNVCYRPEKRTVNCQKHWSHQFGKEWPTWPLGSWLQLLGLRLAHRSSGRHNGTMQWKSSCHKILGALSVSGCVC
jgi:hypothetical protein